MTDIAPPTFAPSVRTDLLAVDTLRFLAADMVEAAQSGHPGMPMGAAPMAWTLWSRHLRHDPADPEWADRDRFVLSAGHGSALLYGLLHLFGYDLPVEELRRFRQLGSRTPGHPEFGDTPGVECTTGPLGQGLAMAVGMALAERMTRPGIRRSPAIARYAIVGDGCLMEGVSHEAASFAGHLGTRRGSIVLWDDNAITIDGASDRSCSDDQLARFAAYGWHTEAVVPTATDIEAIDAALHRAKSDPRPSFLAVRTVIGHGAPGIEAPPRHMVPHWEAVIGTGQRAGGMDSSAVRCAGASERDCVPRSAAFGAEEHASWREEFAAFEAGAPERAAEFLRAACADAARGFAEALEAVAADAPRATGSPRRRVCTRRCRRCRNWWAARPTWPGRPARSAATWSVAATSPAGAIAFGIREFGMAAVLNGMSLHGGFRVFGSTFLVFADYLRPALRLSALMGSR